MKIRKKIEGEKLSCDKFCELKKYDNNIFDDIKIVLCCQNDNDGQFLKNLFLALHAKVEYICLTDVKFENLAMVCARHVKKLSYNLGFVIGNNAKRVFAVNENGEILNGDEILFLLTWWYTSLNKLESHQVCGSVLTNKGIEKKIIALNVHLHVVSADETIIKKHMLLTNSKLGALQSGEVFVMTDKKIENNAFKTARILLTIYYENKNIWKRVKENKYLQIYKTFNIESEKTKYLKQLKQDLKVVADFYRLKVKNNARIELWLSGKTQQVHLLVESAEKTLNFIIFKDVSKKINRLIINR